MKTCETCGQEIKLREYWVCFSYEGQNEPVIYNDCDERIIDHYYKYFKVREIVE